MQQTPIIVQRVYAAKGDALAADALIQEYIPYIRSTVSKLVSNMYSIEYDDALCIAMFAFHEAIESYSKGKGAFLKYAALVMRSRMIDYQRKEKRHQHLLSLDRETSPEDGRAEIDMLQNPVDEYEEHNMREATKAEITELSQQLATFGLTLSDIADNCPKQERTLKSCRQALHFARNNPGVIDELKRTKRLPVAQITLGAGVERKTLERHRKYIMALLLIYSNGYEIIRGHLKQVLVAKKGGMGE